MLRLSHLTSTHPTDMFIVAGDFNLGSDVEWCNSNDDPELRPTNISSRHILDFFDTINTCNLVQFNGERNINNRLLDLVFSNGAIKVSECIDPLAVPIDLHHKPLVINADFVETHKYIENHNTKYMFHRGDYLAITSALDTIDWTSLLTVGSLDQAVGIFYDKIYELRDLYIPVKSLKKSSHPIWYSSACLTIDSSVMKYRILGPSGLDLKRTLHKAKGVIYKETNGAVCI
ncbi:hypothetical protein HW555_007635 [Spodoptera exigua]|uniref:Endonuclease/exonuclease/phosphatase domain-containing protein n=1 Tax=Spodoptera exigua TaxID=7107 RepID=A0A835GFP2_SPOEX|nr:hypothetical protein HW555_007635 [Spodoptera exigua]